MTVCRLLVAALLCATLTCCLRDDDCKLYRTCPGDLMELALANLDEQGAAKCKECLDQNCESQARTCSVDHECNLIARCRLKTNPLDHQKCIAQLYRHGYTTGEEDMKPWEGKTKIDLFSTCRQTYCSRECTPDRFQCEPTPGAFKKDVSFVLAVRKYGPVSDSNRTRFVRDDDVQGRICVSHPCDDIDGGTDAEAGEGEVDREAAVGGAAELDGGGKMNDGGKLADAGKDAEPAGIGEWRRAQDGFIWVKASAQTIPEQIYFELQQLDGGTSPFPPTVYYPRPMVDEAENHLGTAYVVRNSDVFTGNRALGFGDALLEDATQAVILTDGCLWEEISAPGVRVEVIPRDVIGAPEIPQCWAPGVCERQCKPGGCETQCKPCIWYAANGLPSLTQKKTDGSGAGVIGLPEGEYDIKASDDRGVVSKRTVYLKKGYLTIVRTWPVRPD